MNNKEYAALYYGAFNTFHENLVTTRNITGLFGRICVEKIAEYKPNVDFQKDLTQFVIDFMNNQINNPNSLESDDSKKIINNQLKLLSDKYKVSLKDFNSKLKEQIANGTKLGVKIDSLNDKMEFYYKAQQQLFINALQNITTYFEDFISSVFTSFYTMYSASLNNKQFKFEYICNSSSIEEAKTLFIQNEIEDLLRKNIKELFDHLFKTLNIKSIFYEKNSKKILEIFYRRNICVHNKCRINKTYISLSKNPYNYKEGDNVQINEDYIYEACGLLLLTAADIITMIISKIKFDDSFDEESNTMSLIAFECYLCTEDWLFAGEFYKILYKNSHLSEMSKDLYQLNILLCEKKLGKIKKEDIKKKKWDNKNDFLRVGFKCLTEEYSDLERLLLKTCVSEDNQIGSIELQKWPIFVDYRKEDSYKKTLKQMEVLENNKH